MGTKLARGSSQVIEIDSLGEWEDVKARAANGLCDISGTALVGKHEVRLAASALAHSWTHH